MNQQPCVFIIDNDDAVRDSLGMVIEAKGLTQQSFENLDHFFEAYPPGMPGCLVLDAHIAGMYISDLQTDLIRRNISLPMVFLTRYGDLPLDNRTINAGMYKVLDKPVQIDLLIETIQALLKYNADSSAR